MALLRQRQSTQPAGRQPEVDHQRQMAGGDGNDDMVTAKSVWGIETKGRESVLSRWLAGWLAERAAKLGRCSAVDAGEAASKRPNNLRGMRMVIGLSKWRERAGERVRVFAYRA